MGLLASIKTLFARLFSRDPEEARRKADLKRVHATLAELRPPYYRPKQNLVLPGFAQALYGFCGALRPLAELARATVASGDARVSQRFFDHLIECRLPPGTQERKASFAYEGMAERIKTSLDPDREIDALTDEFQSFLGEVESLAARELNLELDEVERFIELCRHDYERILGLFDPGVALDNPNRRPDFAPAEGEQTHPELLDLYYLLAGFFFSQELKANLLRLIERRSSGGLDEVKKKKLDKIFARLTELGSGRLSPDLILALARATKGDPYLLPATGRERHDFVETYRRRLTQQFEKDRERLQRERHESAITADIKTLFGDSEIHEIDGYDDENDAYLRRESPNGFSYIKPLRILKTFVHDVFEPAIKEAVKRLLVEGYFDNKGFQNNLANILYQCERSGGRISDFEEQLLGNGRVSIVAMKRYVEEMRRGKDIASFLTRLVDAINGRAKEIVEDEAGLFAMLGEALTELGADYRRSSPELVTNIRTFGGARNREIISQIQAARDRINVLVKVLRNFTYVKAPVPGSVAPREDEDVSIPAAEPVAGSDDDLPEAERFQ